MRTLNAAGTFLVLGILLGCASSRPAGRENAPQASSDERALEENDRQFARQWDAPEQEAQREAQPSAVLEEPPPPPAKFSEAAEQKARSLQAFETQYARVKEQLANRLIGDAVESLPDLSERADAAGPLAQQRALELSVDVGIASKDVSLVKKSAHRWLLSCGPEKVDSCRRKAFGALARADKLVLGKADPKRKELMDADACLAKTEAGAKSLKKVLPCLDGAAAVYRRYGDRLMMARVQWVKGRVALNDPKGADQAAARFAEAERTCDAERCVEVRRKALRQLYVMAMKAGDLDRAARSALKDMAEGAAVLPEERQPYAWTTEVEQVCAAYDKKHGEGSCRRLERQLNGRLTFKDFSSIRTTFNELSQDQVRAVNRHYNVTLQECLADEAARLVPPTVETYKVTWTVMNDGRVGKVRVDRSDRNEGPLGNCLRQRFAIWRYPRYSGELQHVEQVFSVGARTR